MCYFGIPKTTVYQSFPYVVGAGFRSALVQYDGRFANGMEKSGEKEVFTEIFLHVVFKEKGISEFLVSDFGGIGHVLRKQGVVFRIGHIVEA